MPRHRFYTTLAAAALLRRSPNLHPAIDNYVDSCHVRTFVGGKEQGDTSHFFRSAEATQQRLTEHGATPFWIFQLLARLVGFDYPRRNRIRANPMVATFHRQLPVHADDASLSRGVRQEA